MLNILQLMSARSYVGEAARSLDLTERLAEKGHLPLVLLRHRQSPAQEASHRGLPYESARFCSRFHPYHDWRDMRRIRRLVVEREINVVHAHRGKEHWLAALALRGCPRKVPLVRTRHVIMPIRDHAANRWLYKRATAGVVCVSQAVDAVVSRDLPYFAGLKRVIPSGGLLRRLNGSEAEAMDLRKRLHLTPKTRVLTLVARIAAIKGHLHAVDALARLLPRHPEAVLVFAYSRANTPWREKVEARIAALDLHDRVRWLGGLDRIGPLLRLTDIGLVASTGSEGWSRAAAEFQSCGVPVVATAVGSLPEIVAEGQTGLVVPPADPDALAAAIGRLLDDAELRQHMGRAAAERRSFYSHERMTDDVLAFYEDVLAGNRA